MLDLDKYINNSVEMKIHGEIIHVKQPSVLLIEKIDKIEETQTEDNVREKRLEIALLMLNYNEEEMVFTVEDLKEMTQEAVFKIIATIASLRYEAETDPN